MDDIKSTFSRTNIIITRISTFTLSFLKYSLIPVLVYIKYYPMKGEQHKIINRLTESGGKKEIIFT